MYNCDHLKYCAQCKSKIEFLEKQIRGYQLEALEAEDALGEALGYPLNPGGLGYCIGDHTTGTIAVEAKNRIKNLQEK